MALPCLGLGFKFTSLSPGFSVRRPKQCDTVCWEFDLCSRYFISSRSIVCVDEINRYGWCLTGGRGYLFKGMRQISSVSWIFRHSLHLDIHQTAWFMPMISWSLYCYCKWCRDGKVRGQFCYVDLGGAARGVYYIFNFFCCCCSVVVLLLIVFSWLVHDSCCVCFLFVFCFLCFWSL